MNLTSEQAAALPGSDGLRKTRATAGKQLETMAFPSTSSELWRYSRVEDIELDRYELASSPEEPSGNASAEVLEAVGEPAALVVTVNGHVVSKQSNEESLTIGHGDDAAAAIRTVATAIDIFEGMNAAFMSDPILIDVRRNSVLEKPIVVVHIVSGDRVATFPRLVVRAGEASEAQVIEFHVSDDADCLVAPVVEFDVQQAANLSYTNVQRLGPRVHHVGYNASRVAKDASFQSSTVALGGDYARVRTDSHLVGQGADSKLRAIYFGTGNQMHDFRTLQGHQAPKSTSDLFFKGAVGDTAKSVYSGLIRVDKGASGTNAFQTNRNLVLSSGAHAESVPNLEIEENDVKCSHASAVGPIDEDQRYYLESRGVPQDVASRLIALGFLNEVLDDIQFEGVRSLLAGDMARKLDAVKTGS